MSASTIFHKLSKYSISATVPLPSADLLSTSPNQNPNPSIGVPEKVNNIAFLVELDQPDGSFQNHAPDKENGFGAESCILEPKSILGFEFVALTDHVVVPSASTRSTLTIVPLVYIISKYSVP